MAGHSKWKQIKHKKSIVDAKRGRLFSQLSREITVAAKGGANPETNSRLKSAIERARSFGLPKENTERAITRARGNEGEELYEFLYEATATGGVKILIEGITDNKNRTVAELKHLLGEHGGRLAERGSVAWNFEKGGVLEIRSEENMGFEKDNIEFAIIESGARDFKTTEDGWVVETGFENMENIKHVLEERGIKIFDAFHDYIPQHTIVLEDSTKRGAEKLFDALLEHNDIKEIYINIKK